MPGTVTDDIELIIEDLRGNGAGKPPSRDDDGGGDEGGGGEQTPEPRRPNTRKYSTAVLLGMVSITVFFLVPVVVFVVLRVTHLHDWAGIGLPVVLPMNTVVLLFSSATIELARRKLRSADAAGFRRMWTLTTALGLLFVVGQIIAWRQLAAAGIYAASGLASSFYYLFTALHAVHLLGGVGALFYVGRHRFATAGIGRPLAAEIASYYWHFMDGLWVFLLALLYLGR